jgi:hypothetical protein
MAESELDLLPSQEPRRLHLNWILPVLFRPGRTLKDIVTIERPVWATPLLLLSLLAIIAALVGGPIRAQQALQAQPMEPPPGYEWWTPEQQQSYMDAQTKSAGPLFTYVFPAAGDLLGLWISWVLLGSLLHLALTMAGSRGSSTSTLNLVAWASLPLGIRFIVQIVAVLATQRLIANPGLSGLVTPSGPGLPLFWQQVLVFVDFYVLWRLALIIVGSFQMSALPKARVVFITVLVVLVVLALQALPGYLGARLSGMEMIRPFFF